MRAILIDPVARTVTETEHNGDYKQIYTLLSDPEHGLNVDTFTTVEIDRYNSVFVDDNGLLNDPEYFFLLRGYRQPLAGRGLILGNNSAGESVNASLPLKEARALISFTRLSVSGFKSLPEDSVTDETSPLGPGVPIIGSYPVFGPPKDK